jgi:prepilin-type N-terminal cleavage/methylation domain-containing protein
MRAFDSPRGFSLIEVMVASAILACAVLSVAQVMAVATSSTAGARGVSEATMLAWQKVDELRGLAFTYDIAGGPVTDDALAPSPGGTLSGDASGYVEYLDAFGQRLDDGALSTGPGGARYRRRWAIALSSGDPDAVVLRVRVLDVARDEELASAATIRTRRRP